MPSKKTSLSLLYRIGDYLAAFAAWLLFFTWRKSLETWPFTMQDVWSDKNLYYGLALVPLAWMFIYIVFDKYKDIYRYSRFSTFIRTLVVSFMGALLLFFTIMADDTVLRYTSYFTNFYRYFSLHFGITVTLRMIWLSYGKKQIQNGGITFPTLVIGGDKNAVDLYHEITDKSKKLGYEFIGFVDSNGNSTNYLADHLPLLGRLADVPVYIFVFVKYDIDKHPC